MRRIKVVTHDSAWKSQFEAEAKRIAGTLKDIIVRLHCIGSTAIPGIFAKPIIDFRKSMISLNWMTEVQPWKRLAMKRRGEFGIPGRRYFRKNSPSGVRIHQVHAFGANSSES